MNRNLLFLTIGLILGSVLYAEDFGSAAAKEQMNYDLEEMLLYALEDEHMALAEYNALMKEFGLDRPYSNIARSEETHISYLEDLYKSYDIKIPKIDVDEHLVLPASVSEAAEIAVQAEINNIKMYEIFLKQDLSEDVAQVFTQLKSASENHLEAFKRQLTSSTGSGRNRGGGRNRA
jgi:hypothetical protein